MTRVFIILFIFFNVKFVDAQLPVADFAAPTSVCMNELFQLNNSSVGDSYEWDFCQGDLMLLPTVQQGVQSTGSTTLGVDIVFDGAVWYGFVTDATNNTIIRLSYGADLNATPTTTALGSIFSTSVIPYDIEVVYDNGEWFGFVYGVGQLITRLNFGNSLTNIPTSNVVLSGNGTTSGLDVEYANGKWYITFTQNYFLTIIELLNITDIPTVDNIKSTSLPDVNIRLGDLKIFQLGNNWYGYSVCYSTKKLFRFSFGSQLFSVAAAYEISGPTIGLFTPFGIDGAFDNGQYVLFVSTLEGNLLRVNLGINLDALPLEEVNLGNFGVLSNTLKIKMVKQRSSWRAFSLSYTAGNFFNISFNNPSCTVNQIQSEQEAPELFFTNSGIKHISLRSFSGGTFSEIHKSIEVLDLMAPVIDINSVGNCIASAVQFSFTSDIPIANNLWKYQNNQTNSGTSIDVLFPDPGSYEVVLNVNASNGCANYTKTIVNIYAPPSASFTLPTGLICTNNEFTFTNNTADNFDDNLSFQWLLDDAPVSTDEDLLYTFTTGGDKELILQASIPGCTSESVQVLAGVGEGPTVDFTIDGACLNESTQLTNNSQGDIAGYTWDFGDGQTSSDSSPIVNYASAGNYSIELQTLGTNGCISTKSLPHQIFSVPQPNFNTDLPPFSCNGTPTQFNDLTPPLTDSNINTWQWDFDDQNVSASTQNPQHTYALSGDYNVSLTVTSDQNCVATLNKTISIAQSPSPSITNTAACVETAVVLQETATTTANAWQWQIGNNFYFTASPSHVFSNPGTYQVSLTLTASNGCVGTTTKQINVPAPLAIDFESALNCVSTPTQFTSLVNDDLDPVLTYNWNFGTEQKSGPVVNFLYNQSGIKEVQLTALATSGCFYTITKAIDILPEPKADFSFTPSSGPPPLVVSFTNESTDANTFAWKFNDLNNTISTLNNPSFTFTEVGEYAVDLTASNTVGCESTVSKLITIAFPFLNATLDNFRIIRNTDGSYLLLTNILNNGNVLVQNPLIEIQLDNTTTLQEIVNRSILPGGLIDYTFATQITNVSNLNYACIRLVLPNNEALNNTEACLTFNATSVLTSPYPNPASNSITVEWISPEDEQVAMTVVDNLGNVMATENISSKQGLNTLVLQTMDWQAGIYFIRLKSPSKAHYFRTIIAR